MPNVVWARSLPYGPAIGDWRRNGSAARTGDASRVKRPAKARQESDGSSGPADGCEPDARFTFANERTFLAWNRTSLALVAGGLAVIQLLTPFPGIPWGRHLIGTPLILLGAAVAVISHAEWKANQRALRLGAPLPRSRLPRILAGTIAAIALLAATLALLSAVYSH